MRLPPSPSAAMGLVAAATALAAVPPPPAGAAFASPSRRRQRPPGRGILGTVPPGAPSPSPSHGLFARNGQGAPEEERRDGAPASYYNDDAFGMVFLGASIGLGDSGFGAAFLLLSAAAAVLVSPLRLVEFRPVLPGAVAFLALAAGRTGAPGEALVAWLGEDFASAELGEGGERLELLACGISLAWGIFQTVRSRGDEGTDGS